ncbi:trypsin-like serine peptidase [Thiothrix subterranea]|uniref:Serine protease n=1 Tax=Thiothrix subterranea TaxID=2735563 RepID=A0AA51QVQ9_9GAMM|nr:trypsin-like peptidase domain-containing protein [Thiothrix subterranea]MDQ5771014.1 hypothetical protein [Thiothrix subterranea]WML85073.1 hypothetical protein RCG00_12230 [Thiothrix subterranea]
MSENENDKKMKGEINQNSIRVLYIEMYFNDINLASGTAFFVNSSKGPVFITNRHNLTGCHQETGKPLDTKNLAVPNNIRFRVLGSHEPFWYAFDLYKDDDFNEPIWIEHPQFGSSIDVAGILISEISNAIHLFVNLEEDWHKWQVGDRVHVLGFPFGLNDNFAIWSTGYIASEPATDYKNLPSFLIDCRARPGQSGSLVIARFKPGDVVKYKDELYQAKTEMVHFIGIYSGRINKESDLGIVWKMDVLRDLVAAIESHDNLPEVQCAYHRLQYISSEEES